MVTILRTEEFIQRFIFIADKTAFEILFFGRLDLWLVFFNYLLTNLFDQLLLLQQISLVEQFFFVFFIIRFLIDSKDFMVFFFMFASFFKAQKT